jgi:hypothetical protein
VEQRFLVGDGGDSGVVAEVLHRRPLVIVAVLTEVRSPRHHDDRLSELERSQNRPHASVRDDDLGLARLRLELVWGEEAVPLYVSGGLGGVPDLGKDVGAPVLHGPPVYGVHETIEGKLSADRDEDHRIEPR